MNHGYAPVYPSMVSNRYSEAEQAISKADDVYSKGAMVLHMLRTGLGDELFTKGTRLYLDRFKFRCAETDDFRRCLEEVSGQNLERFFEQWAERPGLARLQVDLEYDAGSSRLSVTIEQSQRIDRQNPAYEFRLPILVKYADDSSEYVYVAVESKRTEAVFRVASKPAQVTVDPNATVLCASTVRKPLAMWIDELRSGPTLIARVRAAEALAGIGGASTGGEGDADTVLQRIANDADEDITVREAAANAVNIRTAHALAGPGMNGIVRVARALGFTSGTRQIAASRPSGGR